jgi:hypothetical protein
METLRVWIKQGDREQEIEVEGNLLQSQKMEIIKTALGLDDDN